MSLSADQGDGASADGFERVESSAAQFAERAKHLKGSDELFISFASKNSTNERKKWQG